LHIVNEYPLPPAESQMQSPDQSLISISTARSGSLVAGLSSSARNEVGDRELREYVSAVLKRKWLVLTLVVVSTVVVAFYSLSLPSIYESTATLQLDPKESAFMQDARGAIIRSYDNDDYQNTQIRLLSNPQLVRKVVLNLDLEHNPGFLQPEEKHGLVSYVRTFFSRPKELQSTAPAPQPPGETSDQSLTPARISEIEPYVSAVQAGLKVQPVEQTSLVNVSMTHTNPQLAMQIVDSLTQTFVSDSNDFETRGSHQAAETLARQIAELQTKIKTKEDARLDYLRMNNLPLEKGEGRNLTADRLGKLSSQLLDAENDRKNLEATFEAANSTNDPSSLASAPEKEQVQDLRKSIRQLQQKRASLTEVYTAEWPEVKQVDAQIAQLRGEIARSTGETMTSLKAKLDAAVARETKLRDAYYKEQGSANTQTREQIELANLEQEIETNRQISNTLFQHQTEMQIKSLDRSNHVAVVTPPVAATAAVGPPRVNKIVIAFFASLFGAIALAVLMKQFDNTLTSVDDVMSYTGLPALALIPAGNVNGRRWLSPKILLRLGRRQKESAPALTNDLRSPAAEAYRHLRASLLFGVSGSSPQKILVTSGSPFEGKTTTAINTAVTLAQNGAQVLLVDCDLRRPRVHHHFDLPNSKGLTSYLSGQHKIDSLMHSPESCPNLKLITAGPITANPADFLDSSEMRNLLKSLGERFDHIVIDSPPASSFADASIISTQVDAVVLVVHSERNSRAVVRRVKERLQAVGASIYGVVLNDVDLASDDYYAGYYTAYE
jgi:polysaccharide biosynthesis transport protein